MPPRNLHAEVSAKIIWRLNEGVMPWRKPWRSYGSGNMPRNAITNRPYSGANVVLLWMEAEARGYAMSKWLTYKQAAEAGGEVRKGEKGSQITFLGRIVKEEEETGRDRAVSFLKGYTVFNVDQCDGLDHLRDALLREVNPDRRDELADEFMRSTSADVRHGESRAYYASKGDYINLPMFEAFKGSADYYHRVSRADALDWR